MIEAPKERVNVEIKLEPFDRISRPYHTTGKAEENSKKIVMNRPSPVYLLIYWMISMVMVSPALAGARTATNVDLPYAIYFLGPGGENVEVRPGRYQIEKAESWLKLVPQGQGGTAAVLLEATQGHHEGPVKETMVRLGPEKENPDLWHLALLHPDGTGLEAVGSKSGIRPRGFELFFLKRMNTRPPMRIGTLPGGSIRFSTLKFSKPGYATKLADDFHARCVPDVETQIAQTLHDGKDNKDILAYRSLGQGETNLKQTGLDEKNRHPRPDARQGIGRYYSGTKNYFYTSNSIDDIGKHPGQSAGVKIILWNHHSVSGRLGSNIRNNRFEPPATGYSVINYLKEPESGRAGGLQIMGRFLMVPYAGEPDYLRLYDLKDPQNPQSVARLSSDQKVQFDFAALTRLNNGRYLAIGGSDFLEIFVTKDANLPEGWESHGSYSPGKAFVHHSTGEEVDIKYRSAQFVTDCDGMLYLVLMRKAKNWRNDYTDNYLDVWRTYVHEINGKYSLELIKKFSKQMYCEGGSDTLWCDFLAGAGIYINPQNGNLLVYGVELGNEGPKTDGIPSIRMKEFRQK